MRTTRSYKLMVVDDERIVRAAVAEHMNWEDIGVQVVKSAANAMEALEYLETNPVDLMLVDIRLPVMDGLQLIEEVQKQYPDMVFIVLSGHAEFEYAQKAIRYGVSDYLLKPIEEETLRSAVLRCIRGREETEEKEYRDSSPHEDTGQYSGTVRQLLNIVDEELSNEELSLKWISMQKMFLNENYLSKVFQKETGEKFSSYVTKRRMELAKQLLRDDPDLMIQAVAARCGYGYNSQYFSSAFKKYTGYTPSEYRKNYSEF